MVTIEIQYNAIYRQVKTYKKTNVTIVDYYLDTSDKIDVKHLINIDKFFGVSLPG